MREPLHDHLVESYLPGSASFIEAAEGMEGMDLNFSGLLDGVGKAPSKIRDGPNVKDEWMRAHHTLA